MGSITFILWIVIGIVVTVLAFAVLKPAVFLPATYPMTPPATYPMTPPSYPTTWTTTSSPSTTTSAPVAAADPGTTSPQCPSGYTENSMGLCISNAPYSGGGIGLPGDTPAPIPVSQKFAVKKDWAHYLGDPAYTARLITMLPNQSETQCQASCDQNAGCTHASWVHGQLVGGGQVLPPLSCSLFQGDLWLGTAPFMADTIINCTKNPGRPECQ